MAGIVFAKLAETLKNELGQIRLSYIKEKCYG